MTRKHLGGIWLRSCIPKEFCESAKSHQIAALKHILRAPSSLSVASTPNRCATNTRRPHGGPASHLCHVPGSHLCKSLVDIRQASGHHTVSHRDQSTVFEQAGQALAIRRRDTVVVGYGRVVLEEEPGGLSLGLVGGLPWPFR